MPPRRRMLAGKRPEYEVFAIQQALPEKLSGSVSDSSSTHSLPFWAYTSVLETKRLYGGSFAIRWPR